MFIQIFYLNLNLDMHNSLTLNLKFNCLTQSRTLKFTNPKITKEKLNGIVHIRLNEFKFYGLRMNHNGKNISSI